MTCDYCQTEYDTEEEGGSITGGDETLDLCESCYEHYYG